MIDYARPKNIDLIGIQNQASQLKDAIKTKEATLGAQISYSVGKGNHEMIILSVPVQQETTADWGNDTWKDVKRNRYIAISDLCVCALDFITDVKSNSSWEVYQSNKESQFIRNVTGLDGVDKGTLEGRVTDSVNVAMHDNDGFMLLNNGQPAITIGRDFGLQLSLDVSENEFVKAFELSVKSAEKPKLQIDTNSQSVLMSSVSNQIK